MAHAEWRTPAACRAYYLKNRKRLLAKANARYCTNKGKKGVRRCLSDHDIRGMLDRPHTFGVFASMGGRSYMHNGTPSYTGYKI